MRLLKLAIGPLLFCWATEALAGGGGGRGEFASPDSGQGGAGIVSNDASVVAAPQLTIDAEVRGHMVSETFNVAYGPALNAASTNPVAFGVVLGFTMLTKPNVAHAPTTEDLK